MNLYRCTKYNLRTLLLCLGVALILPGCGEMDDTYQQYIKDGETIYAGSLDSVRLRSGEGRLLLYGLISDPMVSMVKVFYNNRNDSIAIPVERVHKVDTVRLNITGLEEGSYSFDIFTYDDEGNSSVIVNAIGTVYGENYQNTLLTTPVRNALFNDGKVTIDWGGADPSALGSEIIYKSGEEDEETVYIPSGTESSTLNDYPEKVPFRYRTFYLPEPDALDTFSTEFQQVAVKGKPVEYPKEGWTATANAYDEPSGRGPWNAIDNDSHSVWHMTKASGFDYPHHITVDMGTENLVFGLSFMQRSPLDGPIQDIEIQISNDNVNWNTMGEYVLAAITENQFIDFPQPETFRYFRVICKSDGKNSRFTALAEVGAYVR